MTVVSRRTFLALSGSAPLLLAAGAGRAEETACYDPAALPLSEQGQRKSLGFVEKSADPKRHCGLCTFFTSEEGNCGTCQLMNGAPVTAASVCDSFAAKAGQ